jgi:hypothetical protein
MKHLTLILTLCLCLSVPCSALTLFQTDYDGDSYTTERVAFDYPSVTCGDSSPDKGSQADWLPLRELSETLPYTVEWSEQERTIYIYAERTWEIKPDRYLPEGVMIVDGVTYVSPAYMRRFLPGRAFLYAGELYVFRGEAKRSLLVRGDEAFRRNALTALYRIKLALPKDYRLIRDCLTGGIEQGEWREWMPEGALSYVYPGHKRPTAYIIAGRWANLTELIAHEAYHVFLTRQGRDSEEMAEEYGKRVRAALLETK